MRLTEKKLQQLIRESIFKRIFGKKEKTKSDIPDEIASDFGGGEEKDIVDDFEIEDDSKNMLDKEISRRQAIKAGAGIAAASLVLPQFIGDSTPTDSNILPPGEFRALCRKMLGEFYDLFELNFEHNVASYDDPDFEMRIEPTDEYYGRDEPWTVITYGRTNNRNLDNQTIQGTEFFDSYESAEHYVRETLTKLNFNIADAKKASILRQHAKKTNDLGKYEDQFNFSSEYGGCLVMSYGDKVRYIYKKTEVFKMDTQIKIRGEWKIVERTTGKTTWERNSNMESVINNTLELYKKYNLGN